MQKIDFNQIYKDEYNNVVSYINWKINNISDAEDIAQEVFIKISQHINNEVPKHGDFNPNTSKFSTWLRTITNNTIFDFIRSNKYTSKVSNVSDFVNAETGKETFQFMSGTNTEANFQVESFELKSRLDIAFDTLKPKYKKIAMLYFMEEKSYIEIADICEIPMGTVKGMLNRVREKLQDELKGIYNVRKSNVQEFA